MLKPKNDTGVAIQATVRPFEDLAPRITRQRLIVEGYPEKSITDVDIRTYLICLSYQLGMRTLCQPVTHKSPAYGWAGWIHWETSGAHFYAWEEPHLFFSVDIYTCKLFEEADAIAFTSDFFQCSRITSKGF